MTSPQNKPVEANIACQDTPDVTRTLQDSQSPIMAHARTLLSDTFSKNHMTKAAIRILWKELPHIEEGKQPSQATLDALDQLLKHPEGPEAIKHVVLIAIRAMDIELAKDNTPSVYVKATDTRTYEARKQKSEESAKKHTDFIKAFFSYDRINKSVSLDKLIALIRGEEITLNTEKQESYNEEVYNTRVSRKHPSLSDDQMQGLKSLSGLYQKNGDLHTLGSVKNFAIPSYDETKAIFKDMVDSDGSISLANTVKNNDKMKAYVDRNNLSLDLDQSLETICALGQTIADAWGQDINFDLSYFNDTANEENIEKIGAALRTMVGYNIYAPVAIDDKSVSSLDVYEGRAGVLRDGCYGHYGLAPVLPQQK